MPSNSLVSIIMPTYNRAHIIKIAIQSVLDQTYANWELIIVDDGSSDNTAEVIASFADERLKYTSQPNQGAAAARNTGLQQAKGEWIAYLDSDNELLPLYIETMLDSLSKHPGIVFAIPRANRTLELYENGKLVKCLDNSADTPENLTLKDIFMNKVHLDTNGFMHHRKITDNGIRWDTSLRAMEDWDFAMTVGEHYPDGFLYVPVVLYDYHQRYGGDGIVSNSNYGDWAVVFEQMYQKHRDDKLLNGQEWYPAKVEKWNRLQAGYEAGKLPPYHLYYFREKD